MGNEASVEGASEGGERGEEQERGMEQWVSLECLLRNVKGTFKDPPSLSLSGKTEAVKALLSAIPTVVPSLLVAACRAPWVSRNTILHSPQSSCLRGPTGGSSGLSLFQTQFFFRKKKRCGVRHPRVPPIHTCVCIQYVAAFAFRGFLREFRHMHVYTCPYIRGVSGVSDDVYKNT